MGVLQRFEHRVEELVSGAFARAFRAQLQPVEIAAALQRECDTQAAIVARDRTIVPNRFTVALAPDDYERLAGYAGVLADELARMVREHVDEQGYTLVGPVEVSLHADPELATGRLRVHGEAVAAVSPRGEPTGADAHAQPASPGAPPAGRRKAGGQPARAWAATAFLEVGGQRYPLDGPVTLIGRGEEADLRIEDPAVSRRHAQVRIDGPMAEIVDLGSTNGLIVDGERVERAALADGSRITLGSTTLTFRRSGTGDTW